MAAEDAAGSNPTITNADKRAIEEYLKTATGMELCELARGLLASVCNGYPALREVDLNGECSPFVVFSFLTNHCAADQSATGPLASDDGENEPPEKKSHR